MDGNVPLYVLLSQISKFEKSLFLKYLNTKFNYNKRVVFEG